MNLETLIRDILGKPGVSRGLTFEITKDGGLYVVDPGKKQYWFGKEGHLLRTKDIVAATGRKPYAPGYTTPQS